MDAESLRTYLLSLQHVEETVQWGGALVFWIGEKSIGGKIFAIIRLEPGTGPLLSFAAHPEHFSELLEIDGLIPAPYFARAFWLSLEDWRLLSSRDLQALLAAAYTLVFARLPGHTRAVLAMPPTERKRLIRERKKAIRERQIIREQYKNKVAAGKKSAAATGKKQSAKRTTPKKK
jgi:predicted DNA-binding protein (MmcQ/YjbR family)